MAYDVPTAADLKAMYPAFAGVADDTVTSHLGVASTTAVDTSWLETDYAPAIMAFAAHRMALLNIGDHGQAAAQKAAGVSRLRSGSYDVSFDADAVKAAAGGGLDATMYGREYKRLLGANKAGPRVIGAGLGLGGTGPYYRQNNGVIIP
jgi:hypothetical protein